MICKKTSKQKKNSSPTSCLGLTMKTPKLKTVHESGKAWGANGVICSNQLLCANMRTQTQDGLLGEGVGDWPQSELVDKLLFPHSHWNKKHAYLYRLQSWGLRQVMEAAAAAAATGEGVLHLLDRMGRQKHTKHAQSYKRVLHSLTVKPTANDKNKKQKPLAFWKTPGGTNTQTIAFSVPLPNI